MIMYFLYKQFSEFPDHISSSKADLYDVQGVYPGSRLFEVDVDPKIFTHPKHHINKVDGPQNEIPSDS